MKTEKYQLFRYINWPGHYYVLSIIDLRQYEERHKKKIKMVKAFDNLKEAIEFRDAMNLL